MVGKQEQEEEYSVPASDVLRIQSNIALLKIMQEPYHYARKKSFCPNALSAVVD